LAFLWLAFVILSVVAFFAILFTGRYPISIFQFNVGVLRWSWRVAYYSYGALGTDKYPPFSLRDKPDYPAHLDVDYPEHLSRGLVLIKWWLLVLPHYLIVALFLGGAGYAAAGASQDQVRWGGGLIGLLVLIAGVILLVTGGYPQSLFDLVLGLNRWVLRVAGYASLMTDQYPPFRLDQGGTDTGRRSGSRLTVPPPPATSPSTAVYSPKTPSTATPRRPGAADGSIGWTTGRVVSVAIGCLLGLASLAVTVGGVGLAVVDATLRDHGGFLMTGEQPLTSDTFAITSSNLDIHADAPAGFVPNAVLRDARVTATATSNAPVFVGLATKSDAARYLQGVQHDTVVDLTDHPVFLRTNGSAPRTPPTSAGIWVARSSGTGQQQITWPVQDGNWTVVVMNADGSKRVHVNVAAGVGAPALDWVIAALLSLAGTGLVLSLVLLAVPLRRVPQARAAS
jgi:Domain of unknown function (DUF4389)